MSPSSAQGGGPTTAANQLRKRVTFRVQCGSWHANYGNLRPRNVLDMNVPDIKKLLFQERDSTAHVGPVPRFAHWRW